MREKDGVELFKCRRQAYITVPVGTHHETLEIDSDAFKGWLSYQYYQATGRGLPATSLTDVVQTLMARALHGDGPEIAVHRRVGSENGVLYIDLGDQERTAVVISPGRWTLAPHPVKFWRSTSMEPLPRPEHGGTISELWRFVNAGQGSEGIANQSLILAWVMQAILPPEGRGPYPVLVLHGEQGSAKSFAAKVLRSLVDPSTSPLRSFPDSIRDLFIGSRHSHVLAFDNLSHITRARSDALCLLASGAGFQTRLLQTNQDELIIEAKRPVLLTGIDELANEGDLLSRCLAVELPRVTEPKPEADLWSEFLEARPKLLGALYEAAAQGLSERPKMVPLTGSRLPDFECWGQATEAGLGMPSGSFAAAYSEAQTETTQVALESSLVAPAIHRLLREKGTWEGSAKQLLDDLNQREPGLEHRPRWPVTAAALGKELLRIAPNLRKAYPIDIEKGHRSSERRMWILRYHRHTDAPVTPVIPSSLNSESAPLSAGPSVMDPSSWTDDLSAPGAGVSAGMTGVTGG